MIRLGEHEQVVDDVHHPVDLVGDQGDGFLPLLGSLVESEQFRVAPDDRQWRAQFVARVVQEAGCVPNTASSRVSMSLNAAAICEASSRPEIGIR